jgi:hypothetical protein
MMARADPLLIVLLFSKECGYESTRPEKRAIWFEQRLPLSTYCKQVLSLCQNCVKTLSVLPVGVSYRAKSRCPKLLEINKNERKR